MRNFLQEILTSYDFEVFPCKDGSSGMVQVKNNRPDLIISTMDMERITLEEFLSEKQNYRTIKDIPVILTAREINTKEKNKYELLKNHYSSIKALITLPLKVDKLFHAISDTLMRPIAYDKTECTLDIHVNEGILFVELAGGINRDKLFLLKYKLIELMNLYLLNIPRIVLILTGLDISQKNRRRFNDFLDRITGFIETNFPFVSHPGKYITLLTKYESIKTIISGSDIAEDICIFSNLEEAVERLNQLSVSDIIEIGYQTDFTGNQVSTDKHLLHLKFDSEKINVKKENLTVALVDDDEDIRTFIKAIFYKNNFTIREYASGADFLDGLENSIPDILFLDIVMPGISGLEVIKALQEKDLLDKIAVVVFSGHLNRQVIKTIEVFGIRQYIIKSGRDRETFILKAHEIVRRVQNGEQVNNPPQKMGSKDVKIAIVDDDIFILDFMKILFSEHDVTVNTYENGKQLIDNFPDETPQLIFLDLMMPIMSGFEVLQWLKAKKVNIPVIVLSTLSQKETILKVKKLGIKDFIIKPPSSPELIIKKGMEALHMYF